MARFFAASDKSSPDGSIKSTRQKGNTSLTSTTTSTSRGGSSPPTDAYPSPESTDISKGGDSTSTTGNTKPRWNRRPRLRRQNGHDFDHILEKPNVSTPARSSSDLFGSGFTEAPSSASSASSRGQSKVSSCACSPSMSILEDLLGDVSEDDFSWLEPEPTPSAADDNDAVEADDAGLSSSGDCNKGDHDALPPQQQQPRRQQQHQKRISPKRLAPLELRVEDFECGDCIGKGSYSRVFLGTHVLSGTEWALKVVSKRKTFETRENLAHLKEEKKISIKLQDSDFLVRTAGTFQNPRSVVFAMEYLPGGDLYQRLADKGTLPLGETVAWVAQAVLAIEDLHALNIVHRDIKPENFLMGKSGTLKLTDFGFARELAPGERLFSQFGTPEYVAPEVLNGCGHGKPVDLWALGILIYELLVGKTPFKASNVDEMYERISAGDYAFPPPPAKSSPSATKSYLNKGAAKRDNRARGGAASKGCWEDRFEEQLDLTVEKDDSQDPAAQSLVKSLLCLAPARRPSIAEIKKHPFFEGVNFDGLREAVRAQTNSEEEDALVSAAINGGNVWVRGQPVICLSENVDDNYGSIFDGF